MCLNNFLLEFKFGADCRPQSMCAVRKVQVYPMTKSIKFWIPNNDKVLQGSSEQVEWSDIDSSQNDEAYSCRRTNYTRRCMSLPLAEACLCRLFLTIRRFTQNVWTYMYTYISDSRTNPPLLWTWIANFSFLARPGTGVADSHVSFKQAVQGPNTSLTPMHVPQ
jgi:hypothetical protein